MMPSTISTALPGKKANPEVFLMGGMIPGEAMAGCIYIPFFYDPGCFWGRFAAVCGTGKSGGKLKIKKNLTLLKTGAILS